MHKKTCASRPLGARSTKCGAKRECTKKSRVTRVFCFHRLAGALMCAYEGEESTDLCMLCVFGWGRMGEARGDDRSNGAPQRICVCA